MNQQDVLDAVSDEELIGGVWMRPPSNDVWSLVIWHAVDGWHVAMTGGERAAIEAGSELVTDDESEALENYLERLRALSDLIRAGVL